MITRCFPFSLLGLVGVSSALHAAIVTYPAPAGIDASPRFQVEVQQDTTTAAMFVHFSKAQKPDTNVSQDASWASFDFTGRVTVRVTNLVGDFTRCRVLPSHRAIAVHVAGRTATFQLDRPGQFAVEFDESVAHPLFLFANPPETNVPDRHDPNVIWFDPGIHDLGEKFIEPTSGQTVYLAPGAYVKGRIRSTDTARVRITGRGILSGEHLPENPPGTYTVPHLLELAGQSDRAVIEGITLVASPHYNILARGADSIVRNVKMLGWWYGTDGVGTGPRGLVEDCFFHVNDDALKIYNSGMVVRRCTIWQMENGAAFQLTWNLNNDNSGFRISDCDVIRVDHNHEANNRGVFCAIHGGRGNLSDYVFDDIRVENAHWRLFLLTARLTSWSRADHAGVISNLTFRNITADGPFSRPSVIQSFAPGGRFENITFENLRLGGRVVTSAAEANMEVDPATTNNVRFITSIR